MSVKVNEPVIVGYIMNNLVQLPNRQDIAFVLARRFGLPGADEIFQRQFNHCFASGDPGFTEFLSGFKSCGGIGASISD